MRIALSIAGSDSGGGAGIQADLKTFQRFGVFGTTVITAVTAQNTLGVTAIHPIPTDVVHAQIDALAADLRPHACKTGMLASASLVQAVADRLAAHALPNVVIDPVMVATSGDRLLEADAVRSIRQRLLPLATLVTPNVPEAEMLTGTAVESIDDMERVGTRLLELDASAVLVKGGHLRTDPVVDVLVTAEGSLRLPHPRIETRSLHGTGCTLSAAVAAGLALGHPLHRAVVDALDFVHAGITTAPDVGSGHGPLNHLAWSPSQERA